MSDVGFIVAGYGVILGGLGVYVALLLRRLAAARAVRADGALGTTGDRPATDLADAHRG